MRGADNDNTSSIWVHNNCWDKLPKNSKATGKTNEFGQEIFKGPKGEDLYKGHDGRFYDASKHTPTSRDVWLKSPSRKQWLADIAENKGFSKTNYRSDGQPVFKKGNKYITYDITSHIGGSFKMANSVKNLGSKKTRLGTYDQNLNWIGD